MNELELARRCADAMYRSDTAIRELGIDVEITRVGRARAQMEVTKTMVNGFGVCHGGYLFLLADTAFAYACNAYDRVTFAAAASIDFLQPARVGDRLLAEARELFRGRRRGLYDVTVTNQAGDTVAHFRGRSHATDDPVIASDSPESDTENLEILKNP